MPKLGLNIDHVATLRQARYRGCDKGEPDPIEAALICESAGAHGITAHLREDRRHIQDRDIYKLRQVIQTRLNLEMANVPEIVDIALDVKPDIVCIVPERRTEVTTEGGLDAASHWVSLLEMRKKITDAGIEVSLFITPDLEQVDAAARIGAQFVELHTGAFAANFHRKRERAREQERLTAAAELAHSLGVKVNAGHGLNYLNVPSLLQQTPHLMELNIGHSVISRAVVVGLSHRREGNASRHEARAAMIPRTGIDIIEVARVRGFSTKKFGERFVNKILFAAGAGLLLFPQEPRASFGGPFRRQGSGFQGFWCRDRRRAWLAGHRGLPSRIRGTLCGASRQRPHPPGRTPRPHRPSEP